MISWRGECFSESQVPNMARFWEWLESYDIVKIDRKRDYDSKRNVLAFVTALEEHSRLTVSNSLFTNALNGHLFSNYVLAHEFSHLALSHFDFGTAPKPFELIKKGGNLVSIKKNQRELEADYGAIFFQVGGYVFCDAIDYFQIAKRFQTDPHRLKKAMLLVRQPLVKREIDAAMQIKRVVL